MFWKKKQTLTPELAPVGSSIVIEIDGMYGLRYSEYLEATILTWAFPYFKFRAIREGRYEVIRWTDVSKHPLKLVGIAGKERIDNESESLRN